MNSYKYSSLVAFALSSLNSIGFPLTYGKYLVHNDSIAPSKKETENKL